MKKIRTMTFHHVLNYGAVLQAYALVKFLNDEGHDAKVLNYLPSYFLFQTYRPCKGIKKTADKLKKIKHFYDFRKQHLPITKEKYFSYNQLKNVDGVDAFICGSDQIWNKNLTKGKVDKSFLLEFSDVNSKRISFAASAGSSRISNDLSLGNNSFEKFDALGVREDTLQKDLIEMTNNKYVEVVLDPSLIVNDYSSVSRFDLVPEGEFIVTYVVGSNDTLEYFDQSIKELKQHTKMKVIHLGAKSISSADENILNLGPQDWVAFLSKAKFVVTNSFHGTAFSVNFKKQFIFVPNLNENLNSRQLTLLKSLDIVERKMNDITEMKGLCETEIDYNIVTPKLDLLVEKSKEFLRSALNG
ncbi:hypothetical protein CWO27_11545 [Vibrio sp. 10N.286.51.C3]|uniref:polysaccharide pyruvyl transferase family protein n=1 Tax=unclassified Vibrio TaxID=2614977 RepID=UPI000D38A68B|nr:MULTISPECIES: polysaccharide pyruvyl transferase family protein [unclassified Vibrio]PTP14237.1 hypothetical protein CWO27_11545 [Vibrio sp. 10N.286.51.C3]TKE67238.1 polysaccharide pyruvyl transferase family protein [Vibrio sp. F12]